MYRSFIKRIIDIFLSLVGLIIAAPLILAVLLILIISTKGKPFYVQERPGKNELPFKLYKFKTMIDSLGPDNNLFTDEKRTTKIGKFIRKTSLDELPQLFNVLRGDMSVIGPRPLLLRYLPYYSTKEKIRHSVRPGITGLAQIKGRNLLTWDKKLMLDIFYVKNYSLKMDCYILFQTVIKVIQRKDVAINPDLIFPPLDIERKKK